MTAQDIIQLLKLVPLPQEGGFYRRTYTAAGTLPYIRDPGGKRAYSSAIYYLITAESFSSLHKVTQDELFHFYMGDPVEMIQISDAGLLQKTIIGTDLSQGQEPQVLAPRNVWQGTRLLGNGKWALLGCTLAPAFEFSDFVTKTRAEFLKLFPQHRAEIESFTRK